MEPQTSMHSIRGTSRESNYEGQDIFSDLPDVIIGRILSILPTKEAVRTSILSKRWRNLWKFVTKLHFQDIEPYRRNKIDKFHFLDFVYGVLFHLNNSRIQSFSLYLSEKYDPNHVNRWLANILNRGVTELSINSEKDLSISSYSILESQPLEKLVLKMKLGFFTVPTFVYLSSLIFLKLSGIIVICNTPSNDSKNLTLNFPVLRECEIVNCSWLNVEGVTLEVPLLEVLSIKHTRSLSPDFHSITKVCAPHLRELSYTGHGHLLRDPTLLDLSATHISSAYIYPWHSKRETEEKTVLFVCELLKQLNNNVDCLKIRWPKDLVLAHYDLPVPTFGMLSCLELGNVNGEILLIFLRNTPCLKTLILQELWQFDEELLNPENVPSCFTSNLEEVKFRKIKGVQHELRFAKFVMEYAQVLKRASFSPKRNMHGWIFEKVKKKILSFKRSDSFSLIEF
ncbi:hypothetical protein AAZX31_13G245700 [Glycine max]